MRDGAPDTHDDGCVAANLHLWRAVLYMGLIDVARGVDPHWMASRDFTITCAMAGVEPDEVKAAFDADRLLSGRSQVAIIPKKGRPRL